MKPSNGNRKIKRRWESGKGMVAVDDKERRKQLKAWKAKVKNRQFVDEDEEGLAF